jgi:hypothetical protein
VLVVRAWPDSNRHRPDAPAWHLRRIEDRRHQIGSSSCRCAGDADHGQPFALVVVKDGGELRQREVSDVRIHGTATPGGGGISATTAAAPRDGL